MDDLIKRAAGIHDAIGADMQGFGGILRCRSCGTTADLGNVGSRLRDGWPKCCGYTMEWVTQRQLDEGYLNDPDAWVAKEKAARA